ncbi:hypothetical protein EPA93_10760 [Ktedonosporobacter rubrisoli]|uniref:VOC domain-containing protein n=1 Tax=Ktedonosporobacter rubrisoli TaxID=2509675 RepID=A0A4P6JMJ4_KTERU|nr:VOC family protein [Ktedonosporobacter rubrisoli]QBD76465.1 hypothetical protein EPA93_10760 [Ktedonosporobacter rubrisoli]
MLKHIAVISIPVTDQERAKRFYVDTLGMICVRDNTWGEGMRWIEVAPAGATTTLTLVTWFPELVPGKFVGLVIDSDDLEAEYQRLLAQGVEFIEAPSRQDGGIFALLRDPDGNRITLHQFGSLSAN